MSIDRSFVEKIEEMTKEVQTLTFHGIDYTDEHIIKVDRPLAAKIEAHSLSAVVAFVRKMDSEMKHPFIHVLDQETVFIRSGLEDTHRNRECYLISTLIDNSFRFDQFVPAERFIISLQAQFVQDDITAAILKVVGNIKEEAEHKVMDDGVTQSVTAKTGIAKVENVSVPNPVVLRPYRTFQEIEQPASKFVFRMKKSGSNDDGPTCALYEADGGAWKNEAIGNIEKFLAAGLPSLTIIA